MSWNKLDLVKRLGTVISFNDIQFYTLESCILLFNLIHIGYKKLWNT